MHKFAGKIMECVKAKVEGIGIDNIDLGELTELELWTRVSSNIAKFDYHYKIIDAMEESGAEYGRDYDENGLKDYHRMRDSKGRYMYTEPMMYDERMEDYSKGKMHYSEPHHIESDYDRTRRMYTESKMMNPQDKQMHMKRLTDHLDVFSTDVRDLKGNLTPEERTMWKQKLTNLANEM